MIHDKHIASVQYNDWEGTAAADSVDRMHLYDWLKSKGYMKDGEFLVGISVSVGENHGKHSDPIYVHFLFDPKDDSHDSVEDKIKFGEEPINLRDESVSMNLTEFFGLFKRFSIAISAHGMLDKKEYRSDNY